MVGLNITNHFLIGLEACTTGEISICYCKPSQKPMAGEVIDPQIELAIVILLNIHAVKFVS